LANAGFSVFIDSLISDFVSPEFYRPSLTATQPDHVAPYLEVSERDMMAALAAIHDGL
jgi:hypothetical protein